MSVPISFGDIIAAISLATNIWTTCFSSTSCAQLEYSKYGEQVKGLGNSLNSLYQILSDHENNLRRRGQKRQVDSMDLSSLADIVGDFEGTLRKTQSLLKKYAVFKEEGGRSYVKKIRWSLEAKSEVLG